MHANNRLVVLGAGGVGKTSLVDRFVNDNFSETYSPTIEDIHRHLVQLPGKLSLQNQIFFTVKSDKLFPLFTSTNQRKRGLQ